MKIGIFGSCQTVLTCRYFLSEKLCKDHNLQIIFSLNFFDYDPNYKKKKKGKLDYKIFDELDIILLMINNLPLDNQASSINILNYCSKKKIKIIKIPLIKFPIYPINWSGKGENKKDYINWNNLNNIDYKKKFETCINKCRDDFKNTDVSMDVVEYIKNNFNKKLLFTHSLHPTNILLYELWKNILNNNLSIDISQYQYNFKKEIINCWYNPFTKKMIKDLNIKFETIVDDKFYIDRYEKNKSKII